MIKKQIQSKTIGRFITIITSTVFILLFQNCSKGHVDQTTQVSTSTSLPEPITPPEQPKNNDPQPAAPLCSTFATTPSIATQSQWDAKFNQRFGAEGPALTPGAETFAWQGYYWVRAYVSMAKTYGSTKYLDLAVKMINYWFANQESNMGWGATLADPQMMLDTGVIAQAVMIFSYQVWSDSRFLAYRSYADTYIAKLEPILRAYDSRWVDHTPYPGSPGFYVYASCGGLCSPASLMMYNQGAAFVKALLLLDRTKRLKGQIPDSKYLEKSVAATAYFKTFAKLVGNAYEWDYGGARQQTMEDTSHGHLDLSLLITSYKLGLGGLTMTDMNRLVGTFQKVLNGDAGSGDVSLHVNGAGLPNGNITRVTIGYDWIDLADFEPALLDKTTTVFNKFIQEPSSAREFLGWAEIQRKRRCINL